MQSLMSNLINSSLNVAVYCRLSREDEDSKESSSISSQKEMLTEYATKNHWNVYDYYIDDGFSGTNFNRPAFKRMIADIENKKINIVITKDLSCLGRNYLDTGRYTEEYFPLHNIRYIAITDNYDSNNGDNELAPFKNIINEWYAKDISKKVKSVFDMKHQKGKIPSASIPLYGYKHEKEFERVIDEDTAPVVRTIFDLYLKGTPISQISDYLFQHKIYNPGYYNAVKYGYFQSRYEGISEEDKYRWNDNQIRRIIDKKKEYTGALVYGKIIKISFKLKKRVRQTGDNLTVIENRFPAIITDEQFEACNNLISSRSFISIDLDTNKYKNMLVCSCCGKFLRYKNYKENGQDVARYVCRNAKCENKMHIKKTLVDETVNIYLEQLKSIILKDKTRFIDYVANYEQSHKEKKVTETKASTLKKVEEIETRNQKLELLITKLFEAKVAGEVPQAIYEKMMAGYKGEADENEKRLSTLKKQVEPKLNHQINYEAEALELVQRLESLDSKNLTRESLLSLIKSIHVTRIDKQKYYNQIEYYKLNNIIEEYINESTFKQQ